MLSDVEHYDFKVIATYAGQNKVLSEHPEYQRDYQFELCEKPVVRLPASLRKKSIVILDGPFMCVDPLGNTGMSVMGNVEHAIHNRNIGKHPEIDERFIPFLNKGIIKNKIEKPINLYYKEGSEFYKELSTDEITRMPVYTLHGLLHDDNMRFMGVILSPFVIRLIYGQAYEEAIFYAQLVFAFMWLVIPTVPISEGLLPAQKRNKRMFKINLYTYGIWAILLVILVPMYGLMGAVMSYILNRLFTFIYITGSVKVND